MIVDWTVLRATRAERIGITSRVFLNHLRTINDDEHDERANDECIASLNTPIIFLDNPSIFPESKFYVLLYLT